MKVFILILCIVGILTDLSTSKPSLATKASDKTINYRLNTDVEPFDYVLELTPYFENNANDKEPFTFDGICNISIKSNKPGIDTITLHKDDIKIVEQNLVKVSASNGESIAIKSSEYDDITSKYTLKLATPLTQDESYILNFKYVGRLQSDMHGFYRSSYTEGNVTKWLAATQMEPIYARKAFPCFDEPRFKATFSVIINRPAHFQPSLSNTAMVFSYYTSSNTVREYFKKTPRMSSYLVAFVVSEFECRENQLKNFYVCSRPNAFDQTEYSFQIGQQTLKALEDLFDYKYSTHMSKMAMAAIPDFFFGAMENWGLLTYRETALLYDPKGSTAKDQQSIAAVVAHEQVHMWFGNLVTCDWWAHFWLNEGFARYFQYFGMALVEDGWGLDQQFVIEQMHSVFSDDSLGNSLALSHDANTPDEVMNKVGSISYNKGASVIRMMSHTLGNDRFIAALRNYLKTNALQTGLPEKLFAAFQKVVGNEYNITEFMNSWVYQPGYPVLDVKVAKDRKHVSVSQKRFLRNNPNHQDKTRWNVPITYATDKFNSNFTYTKPVDILSNESLEIELNDAIDWIVFNVQQSGYYRVNYDDDTWTVIANILHKSHSSIHVLNRAQVVNDALTLARADILSYKDAFYLIRYLKNEIDYVPWSAAFDGLNFILGRFKEDESPIFQKFVLGLLDKVYQYLGFKPKDSDTRLDIYNRNNVLKNACHLGYKQCIADAHDEFNQLLHGNYTVPVDLAPVVYCSAVAEGSDKEWNFLWNKFNSVNVATEKVTILNALGCAKQDNLITKYLKLILSDAIRLQDKHKAFVSTLTQGQRISEVLDFIVTNHSDINAAFGSSDEVPKLLTQVLSVSTTREQIDKIEKFANENKLNLKTALETAKLNLKWAEENVPIIKSIISQMD